MLNLFIFIRKEKVRLKLAHKLIPTLSLEKLEKSTMSYGTTFQLLILQEKAGNS